MLEKSHKHVSCSTCGARQDSMLGGLCSEDVKNVESHRSCNFYRKNQSLFLEGSFPRGVYCINEGKVKVYRRGAEGKEQIIQVLKKGDMAGFRAMFHDEPYSVGAETLEESNICFIPKDDFLNMMDTNAVLRNSVIRELSRELSERAEFITNMAQKSVRERLAFSLVLLMKIYGDDPINLTREDLANFVGTATETLIRLVKDFKDEGLIEIQTRKISVLQPEKLIRLAGGRN
jgi:CRP/FNR family transcriptional regulator, polysaccharide utilization system transcription regulator